MAKKSGRSFSIILVILILGGLAFYFFADSNRASTEWITTPVVRGTLVQTVTATGAIQPVEQVEVSSQISGLIKDVLVDYNSVVKKGDVLAKIDPASYISRLDQAQASLANVKANYDLVKLKTTRTRSLRESNLVSQQDLDQAEASLAQAEAQLQISKAAVEDAKVDLSRCEIYAPIDGIVLDRPATIGKTVAASLNAPILFLLVNDLRHLQIEAAVSEADIGSVAEQQSVDFTVDAFPNRTFEGKVRQIRNSPQVEQNVITYTTVIDVDNKDLRLKPGMTANVSIIVNRRENVLIIPNSTLRARVPDELKLAAKGADATAADAAADEPSPEETFRALLKEVGYDGKGRPSREMFQQARSLAAQRGITLPEPGTRRGRRGGNVAAPDGAVSRNATIYLPAGSDGRPMAQPLTIRVGITDGSKTEVLSGLKVDEQLISGVQMPVEGSASGGGGIFGLRRH